MPERRHHDDELGLFEGGERDDRIGAVELRLHAEQDVSLARLRQHRLRVQSLLRLRDRIGHVASDAVRRLGEATQLRADDLGERLRQREELRRFLVLFGVVSEQDRRVLAGKEARGDDLRRGNGLDIGERRGNGLAGALCGGDDDFRERLGQERRRSDQRMRDADSRVVGDGMENGDLGALARRVAQPLREERMVLAQEAADDEGAIERIDLGDRHAEPRKAGEMAVAAEIALAEAEVDVIRAERPRERCGERHLLQRRVRRHERPQCGAAVHLDDGLEPARDEARAPSASRRSAIRRSP